MADDNKKSPFLNMATPKQHIPDSF